jgi:hypothetical protein
MLAIGQYFAGYSAHEIWTRGDGDMTETNDADAEPSASPKTILVGNQEMTVEMATLAARNSARWFWWIAGLSAINSIASLIQAEYSMVLGLGVTQILDGLYAGALSTTTTGTGALILQAIYVVFLALAIGFFYQIGVMARELRLTAYLVGMIVYALDGLIFALFQDWIGVGFHLFVLFMLWGGFGIARAIRAVERAVPDNQVTGVYRDD